jgi:hypothetical protein
LRQLNFNAGDNKKKRFLYFNGGAAGFNHASQQTADDPQAHEWKFLSGNSMADLTTNQAHA